MLRMMALNGPRWISSTLSISISNYPTRIHRVPLSSSVVLTLINEYSCLPNNFCPSTLARIRLPAKVLFYPIETIPTFFRYFSYISYILFMYDFILISNIDGLSLPPIHAIIFDLTEIVLHYIRYAYSYVAPIDKKIIILANF